MGIILMDEWVDKQRLEQLQRSIDGCVERPININTVLINKIRYYVMSSFLWYSFCSNVHLIDLCFLKIFLSVIIQILTSVQLTHATSMQLAQTPTDRIHVFVIQVIQEMGQPVQVLKLSLTCCLQIKASAPHVRFSSWTGDTSCITFQKSCCIVRS